MEFVASFMARVLFLGRKSTVFKDHKVKNEFKNHWESRDHIQSRVSLFSYLGKKSPDVTNKCYFLWLITSFLTAYIKETSSLKYKLQVINHVHFQFHICFFLKYKIRTLKAHTEREKTVIYIKM